MSVGDRDDLFRFALMLESLACEIAQDKERIRWNEYGRAYDRKVQGACAAHQKTRSTHPFNHDISQV